MYRIVWLFTLLILINPLNCLPSEKSKPINNKCPSNGKEWDKLVNEMKGMKDISDFSKKNYSSSSEEFIKYIKKCVQSSPKKYRKNCLQEVYLFSTNVVNSQKGEVDKEDDNKDNKKQKFLDPNATGDSGFELNKDILGLDTFPKAMKNRETIEALSSTDRNEVEKAMRSLEKKIADELRKNKVKAPKVTVTHFNPRDLTAGGGFDGNEDGRIAIQYDDGRCIKTYLLSAQSLKKRQETTSDLSAQSTETVDKVPTKTTSDLSAQSLKKPPETTSDLSAQSTETEYIPPTKTTSLLASCYRTKEGAAISPSKVILHDYGRRGDGKITAHYDRTNKRVKPNCLSCHSTPAILLKPKEASDPERIKRINENLSKINQEPTRWAKLSKNGIDNTITPDTDLVNINYPAGLLKDPKDREDLFSKCITSPDLKKNESYKEALNKAMKCTRCHNGRKYPGNFLIDGNEAAEVSIKEIKENKENKENKEIKDPKIPGEKARHQMPPDINEILSGIGIANPKSSDAKTFRDNLFKCLNDELSSVAYDILNNAPSCSYFDEKEGFYESPVKPCNKLLSNLKVVDEADRWKTILSRWEGYFEINDIHAINRPPNYKIKCSNNPDIPFIRPIETTPGCDGGCRPFKVDMMFDKKGNFIGLRPPKTKVNFRPTRYGHEYISDKEFQEISDFVVEEINKEYKNQTPSAYNKPEYVVDGLTGATRVGQRGAPRGAAYTTQAIFKYVKSSINEIRGNQKLKEFCDDHRKRDNWY